MFISLLCLMNIFVLKAVEKENSAHWISASSPEADCPNTWIAFRQDVFLNEVPVMPKQKLLPIPNTGFGQMVNS